MLGAERTLGDGQQRGEQVAGPGRIPLLPGPVGEAVAGGQGGWVPGAIGVILYMSGDDQLEQVPGRLVAAAVAKVPRDLPHAVAGQALSLIHI